MHVVPMAECSRTGVRFPPPPLSKYVIIIYMMFMDKLKNLFRVSSTYQLIVVFIVFGITGSMSLVISDYISEFFNLDNIILSIIFVLMIYQVLLIIIGTLFGEFDYFWEMEKKILSRFKFKKDNN